MKDQYLSKSPQVPLSTYRESPHPGIAEYLSIGDRIYMNKRYWTYTNHEPKEEEITVVPSLKPYRVRGITAKFIAYQVASKPVFFAHSGNWCFRATTTARKMGLTSGRNSYQEFTEQVYLNTDNLADFLFKEESVGRFLDKHKQHTYVKAVREKEAAAEQERNRMGMGKFKPAPPRSEP